MSFISLFVLHVKLGTTDFLVSPQNVSFDFSTSNNKVLYMIFFFFLILLPLLGFHYVLVDK